jgi:hypothetical protein
MLGYWHDPDGNRYHGIRPQQDIARTEWADSFGESLQSPTPLSAHDMTRSSNATTRSITFTDISLAFFVLGTTALIVAYYLATGSSGFNDFFNSNTFGPRFIMTMCGTIVVTLWKDLEYGTSQVQRVSTHDLC